MGQNQPWLDWIALMSTQLETDQATTLTPQAEMDSVLDMYTMTSKSITTSMLALERGPVSIPGLV